MTEISYLETVGNALHIHYADASVTVAYSDGRRRYLPHAVTAAAPPPPVDLPPPGAWHHPAPGTTITSPYGPRGFDGVGNYHWGVDLASGTGAPGVLVRAATAMVITIATDADGGTGAGTHVKGHSRDNAYTFNYFHMAYGSLQVRVGDTVPAGAPLGTEGSTGNVTGKHLHFEIYEGNYTNPWPPPYGPTPVDPVPFLNARGIIL